MTVAQCASTFGGMTVTIDVSHVAPRLRYPAAFGQLQGHAVLIGQALLHGTMTPEEAGQRLLALAEVRIDTTSEPTEPDDV